MSKTLMALAVAGLLVSAVQAHTPAMRPADPAPVIAAERAFAARAAVVGIAPSFLEYMSDQAIVFGPDPTNAKAFYSARPPGKAPKDGGTLLAWWPNFAGLARSGDLGFTTGPASVNGGKPDVVYVTIWARQADGGWKWIFDGGIEADGAGAPGPAAQPIALPPGDTAPMTPARAWSEVSAAERRIAGLAGTDAATALKAALAPNAWVQGSKAAPATTAAAVDRELATRARTIAFSPLGGGASKAGDLVWTYGDARWKVGRGHYVRVWQRRAGKWALVFDQIIEVETPA